jgi:hypothetical protein
MTGTTLPSRIFRNRTILAAGLAALAVGVTACGGSSSSSSPSTSTAGKSAAAKPSAPEVSPSGDIPDNQAYVAFSPPGGGFSVKVPEGWSRSSAGGAVTFTDKLNSIRVESAAATTPLTVQTARQTELPKLAGSVAGFKAGTVSTVQRSAGSAVRMTYQAKATPNAVTGKAGTDAIERYVFFHNGKRISLTLSGPKGADNVDPWKIVTDSVRWTA